MNAEEFPAIVAGHPDDFDACDCAELGQHILAVQGSRLRSAYAKVSAEQVQLRATVADLDDALTAVLAERDALERLLDTFAYTVAPVEEIGEHSSANCPWRNALERLQ